MITIQTVFSNKQTATKPARNQMGRFFGKKGTNSRIKFNKHSLTPDQLQDIIGNGHVIGYFCDDVMCRKSSYKGTQYIVVDIDEVTYTAAELMQMMKYTPTVLYTSYSNCTVVKNYKYCYHLIYIFDKILWGEDNFYKMFNLFTTDYKTLIDTNAKDCHRITFGSNSKLPNYQYIYTDTIYKVDDYKEYLDKTNYVIENKQENKKNSKSSNTNSTIITKESKKNEHPVNEFFRDFYDLSFEKFLIKYCLTYTAAYTTPVTFEEGKSFTDLSQTDYYVVNAAKYRWDNTKKKNVINKVVDGHRHNQLYKDAVQFLAITPQITLEGLVYSLCHDYYHYYDHTNCSISKKTIVDLALQVMKMQYKGCKTNKKMMVNKDYFGTEVCKYKMIGQAAKDWKDEQILMMYDVEASLEENLKNIREFLPVKKERIIQCLHRNHINYKTQKEIVEKLIKNSIDLTKSVRENLKFLEKNVKKISIGKLQKIMKEMKENNKKISKLSDYTITIITQESQNFEHLKSTENEEIIYNINKNAEMEDKTDIFAPKPLTLCGFGQRRSTAPKTTLNLFPDLAEKLHNLPFLQIDDFKEEKQVVKKVDLTAKKTRRSNSLF